MTEGEQFLHKKYSDLHTSEPVEHEQARRKKVGEETSQKPADKISDFLEVIKRTHGHHEDPRVLERIKEYYHKEYVIKPEDVPESYFDNQKRIAREQGRGDIEITEELREQAKEVIIADQKSTLDNWVEYLSSKDADVYPIWARYWAFRSMVNLSTYDKEKKVFSKRKKDTVAPFPDLNREALANVVDIIVKKAQKENIRLAEDNPELQELINQENFGKLYAYAIEKITPTEVNELEITTGKWVKYNQGSDHMPLVESLQGFGTGWCTAGESTAQTQLRRGDFYVYYSHNKDGKPIIPRIAIRMNGNQISEVRGVAPEQNLDPYINDVVKDKLKEFPDGKLYEKKVTDMKKLTEIDNKDKQGKELTKKDLCFIYEINSRIKGFGHQKDPRIKEILQNRNIKKDLTFALDCSEDQISTTKEEALRGNIRFHYGDLNLKKLDFAERIELPKFVSGDFHINDLSLVKGLKLPESVGDCLFFEGPIPAEGFKLPKFVGGDLYLNDLTSAKGLKFPESVDGSISSSLTSAEGLKLPKFVGGSLYLHDLTSVKGFKPPKFLGGHIGISNISLAEKKELEKQYPQLEILPLPREYNQENIELSRKVNKDSMIEVSEVGGYSIKCKDGQIISISYSYPGAREFKLGETVISNGHFAPDGAEGVIRKINAPHSDYSTNDVIETLFTIRGRDEIRRMKIKDFRM